mgnify:CR=1 FL=1
MAKLPFKYKMLGWLVVLGAGAGLVVSKRWDEIKGRVLYTRKRRALQARLGQILDEKNRVEAELRELGELQEAESPKASYEGDGQIKPDREPQGGSREPEVQG